ncbi:hypothetical protein Hs30E_01140 [Lactococcus hodotermopsidis]|uniref:Uncharacterized protein n=1 Tax=Pseudolactococcus hodotermopsidis TaxID=2709157 RepID=A0A6A0BAA1_9LACT|nr:hypothetical protein [Lactococcus hodotermopsidis]GFH41563.1 hypothetical protein Hs30E_01140 [Lactococcus hodotermopsidis]
MKKLRNFLAIVVLVLLLFLLIFNQKSDEEAHQLEKILRTDTHLIYFDKISENDQKEVFELVKSVAKKEKINIYRRMTISFDKEVVYLELNDRKDRILSEFNRSFVDEANHYEIKPIDRVLTDVGYITMLEVQGSDQSIQRLQDALADFYPDKIEDIRPVSSNEIVKLLRIAMVFVLLLLLICLLLIEYYRSYQDTNILLLIGYDKKQLIWRLFKTNYFISLFTLAGGFTLIFLSANHLAPVLIETFIAVIVAFVISFVISTFFLRKYKISKEVLNGKTPLEKASQMTTILSMISATFLLVVVLAFGNLVTEDIRQISSLPSINRIIEDYTVSDRIHIDMSKSEKSSEDYVTELENDAKWFQESLSNGALLADKHTSTDQSKYMSHEVFISSTYLDIFKIADENGKPIKIDDTETDMIELIPVNLKNKTSEILDEVQADHDFQNYELYEDFAETKVNIKNQVKVIYIKPQTPTFDINVGNKKQVIYRVFTSHNITSYSGYGGKFLGVATAFFKKNPINEKNGVWNNDPNNLVNTLSKGIDAKLAYDNRIIGNVKMDISTICVFMMMILIYFYAYLLGLSQFRSLNHDSIRTKALVGFDRKMLYLPYFGWHFIFSVMGFVASIVIANVYMQDFFVMLFLINVLLLWRNGRNQGDLQDD